MLVHSKWTDLKGSGNAERAHLYEKAKRSLDHGAADELVSCLINTAIVEQIVSAVIASNKPARVVVPWPEFDPLDGGAVPRTNAIPSAFGAFLAAELGGEVDSEIVEVARPGRTRLKRFPRFLWQPSFEGDISPAHSYVLADDMCTLGGTLAALRAHIVGGGGTVVAVTSLATNSGVSSAFPIAEATLNVLLSSYSAEVRGLWLEEVGHDVSCLSDAEGAFLIQWEADTRGTGVAALQRLRDRLAKARACGE